MKGSRAVNNAKLKPALQAAEKWVSVKGRVPLCGTAASDVFSSRALTPEVTDRAS
jgi:hypothetical protein